MWMRPFDPWKDGLFAASVLSLGFLAIFTFIADEMPRSAKCQETVVDIAKKGDVLARCPVGTYIELTDNYVVCRCGTHMVIEGEQSEPAPLVFPPLEIVPNAEPKPLINDKGIDL